MSKVKEMAMTIKELRDAAAAINDAADWLAKQFGGDEVTPEREVEPKKEPEPQLALEDVRAVLANMSRKGHTAEIRTLLQKYGASRLSGIDPANYKALLKEVEGLENGNNHALLSASSAHRWLNCPPSARLCESYEDKGSDYAAEGTDAHSLCEFKLKKSLGMEADDPTAHLSWFNQEMDDCSSGYSSFVTEIVEEAKKTCPDPVVLIEQRVDFSRWVEKGFGTADCIVISDGTLHYDEQTHLRQEVYPYPAVGKAKIAER